MRQQETKTQICPRCQQYKPENLNCGCGESRRKPRKPSEFNRSKCRELPGSFVYQEIRKRAEKHWCYLRV